MCEKNTRSTLRRQPIDNSTHNNQPTTGGHNRGVDVEEVRRSGGTREARYHCFRRGRSQREEKILIINKINIDRTAADEQHNSQPEWFELRREEDGEEGRRGAGEQDANAPCLRARRERGDNWQCSASSTVPRCWVMTLSDMTPIWRQGPPKYRTSRT